MQGKTLSPLFFFLCFEGSEGECLILYGINRFSHIGLISHFGAGTVTQYFHVLSCIYSTSCLETPDIKSQIGIKKILVTVSEPKRETTDLNMKNG